MADLARGQATVTFNLFNTNVLNEVSIAPVGTATVTFNLTNFRGNLLAVDATAVSTVTATLTQTHALSVTPAGTGAAVFSLTSSELLAGYYTADVTVSIQVAFTDFPLATTPTWTDITSDVRGFNITRGRSSELDDYQAGVLNVIVDANTGNYDPTDTAGAYYPNIKPMKQIRVRASYGPDTHTLFYGFVERWPMTVSFTDETVTIGAVDGFKVLNLVKDSTAQSEELSSVRVGNLLDEAGWPAGWRTLGTGVATIPAFTPDCATVATLIRQVKDSEAGQFYINADGKAIFRNRTYRSGLSSVATFGDGVGETPYQGITTDYDDSQIWNRIEVYASGFPSYSSSTASQDAYGIRTLPFLDILLPDTTSADDLADVYRDRYKDPKERVESLTLKPEASPALLWPQVLGRDLSEKVTVKYRTNNGNAKTAVSYIEAVNHQVTMSPRRWQTRWKLSQYE